jgi:hypothetical protein
MREALLLAARSDVDEVLEPPSTAPKDRNLPQVKGGGVFPHLHPSEIRQCLHATLESIFGARRNKAKLAAKAANSNPRAAKQWFLRENGMSVAAFINLARQVPEFRAAAQRLMAMESESDPEFQRAFAEFYQLWLRMRR